MFRTHTCNELTKSEIGTEVNLCGWVNTRRDHGGLIFIDLRDRYGLTQVVFDPSNNNNSFKIADKLRSEFVIKISGTVRERPEGMRNSKLNTGEIEVLVNDIDVLNKSKTPPFEICKTKKEHPEDLRLRYRYLDLRRDKMKNNIVLRHKMIKMIRDFMDNEGFLEVETPILIKGTPEGSREYLVPARLHPGTFYVLPQSPQQLKQLLMVAGMDKYFQIARCFRDEDQRGDRQPEFTQLDMEMSFVDTEDIIDINERLMIRLIEELLPDKKILKKPVPRITWHEAMEKYGSDKPDTRFGLELSNISEIVKNSEFKVFSDTIKKDGVVKALRVEDGGSFTRSEIDKYEELAQIYGAKGMANIIIGEKEHKSPILKFLSDKEVEGIIKETEAKPGDIIFIVADDFVTACESLGNVRLALGEKFELIDENLMALLWVTDFPLFEWGKEENAITASHHPFCMPHDEDIKLLDKEPLKVRAKAYDFVLNGSEVGGGSIRIHDRDLQKKIFEILKISEDDAKDRFGHMLKAFEYGAPPHGGIAWGLDRVVMQFAGEPNIREVIPFPKDQKARDLMLDAPSVMPEETVKEMHIMTTAKMDDVSPFMNLKEFLNKNHTHFEHLEHEPVITSEQAAKVRGTTLEQAAKAIIFETDTGKVMTVVSAANKINESKVKDLLKSSKLTLLTEEKLFELTKCKKGAVHPFGNLFKIKVLTDKKLKNNDEIVFNAGSNIDSMKIKYSDYLELVKPEIVDIT